MGVNIILLEKNKTRKGQVTDMDMRVMNAFQGGAIDQYAPPLCFELAGKQFCLIMDDGYDFDLHFIDGHTLTWSREGSEPKKEQYLCAKGDNTTYLVSYELAEAKKRTNYTWVLDLENGLVTRVYAVIGKHPRFEYLITPAYEFGAIKTEDAEVGVYPRHGFTDDLTGNFVQWNYGGMETVHVYYCSNFYRITYPPERAASRVFNEALAKLPSSDEPTAYIKIKEGLYLFSLTESNMEKIVGGATRFRSNTMAFLQNYKRMYLVGRTFGTTMAEGQATPLHKTFGAFGKILQPTEEYLLQLMTDPNPFSV